MSLTLEGNSIPAADRVINKVKNNIGLYMQYFPLSDVLWNIHSSFVFCTLIFHLSLTDKIACFILTADNLTLLFNLYSIKILDNEI